MPDSSADIESDNVIKRYQRRPKQLEKLCLADFVAWFNYIKDEHAHSSTELLETGLDDFVPETNFDDDTVDDHSGPDVTEHECKPNEYLLKEGMKLVRRKKSEIIRSVRYHKIRTRKTITEGNSCYIYTMAK